MAVRQIGRCELSDDIQHPFDPSDPEQDGTRRQFYDEWYRELISELTGYVSFQNVPTTDGNGRWGCLTGSEERKVNLLICQKFSGMTLDHWQAMSILKRISYLRSALKLLSLDNDNYVPFGCVWPDRLAEFDSYAKAKTFLDNTPESKIRRRKPSKQRLQVHAGDWCRYWAEHRKISDAAAEGLGKAEAERKAEIDAKRAR